MELLHYDTRNPLEVCPEYSAGVKAANDNRRVDFAILKDTKPIILVEVKSVDKHLESEKYTAQLYQYYAASEAQFAIFTNGLVWRFYTDIKKTHIMDYDFFLEIDLEDLDVRVADVIELFKKGNFDADYAKTKISEYNSARQMREYISHQLATFDDDELVRLIVKDTDVYNSHKNDMALYRTLTRKAFDECVKEYVASKNALSNLPEKEVAEQNAKEQAVQAVISFIKESFAGQIIAEKVSYWETKKGVTIAYFGVVLCYLYFYDNGELFRMVTLTTDDSYPRKNKHFFQVDRRADFTKYKDEFSEQIEQTKRWVKKAANA